MKRFFMIFLLVVLALTLLPIMQVMGEAVDATPAPVVVTTPFFNLTGIVTTLLGLLGVLITTKLWPWIEANTTESQRRFLQLIISTLVYAAEQLYGGGRGTEKMEYVQNELRKRGLDIDIAEIEASVHELTLQQDMIWKPEPLPEPVTIKMTKTILKDK